METQLKTETKANGAAKPSAENKADAINAEVSAVKLAFAEFAKAIANIKAEGLKALAREVGEKANTKSGRPEFETWSLYVSAVCSLKPTAALQNECVGIARGALKARLVRDKIPQADADKVLGKFSKQSAKGSADGSTSTRVSLSKPAAWDIAFE